MRKKIFSIHDECIEDRIYRAVTVFGKTFLLFDRYGKPVIDYLETHVCDHCNLSCKGCRHFCPLVDKEIFTDIKQFEKDMFELASKIHIKRIRLLGGEPLLHPNIAEFFRIARKAFPKSEIGIVSNLLLIKSMDDSFWRSLKKYKIKLDCSLYPPIEKNFKEIKAFLKTKGISINAAKIARQFFKWTNPKGDSNPERAFHFCISKGCTNLWNSKLYSCPMCYSVFFNQKFGQTFPEIPGYDIYAMSGKELTTALSKPMEACRFCSENIRITDWEQSKQQADEWL